MNNAKETFKLFQSACIQSAHVQILSTSHHISVLVIFLSRQIRGLNILDQEFVGVFSMWEASAKKTAALAWHLTSVSCYMERGRPYIALIFTEWAVEIKWDWQGTLSQLSGGRDFLLFSKFLHRSRERLDVMREQSWLPNFSQLTPSFSHRRSEHPGRAPLRGLPSTAVVESSAGLSLGLVWWPQKKGMVAELHWQTE